MVAPTSVPGRPRRWREAWLAFSLGMLAMLVLLELGLRVTGAVFQRGVGPETSGEFTILCVGDSYTYGLGAPSGRGWPGQLEELLEARGLPTRAVNRGVLSGTSHDVFESIEDDISQSRPDLVLMLVGSSNPSDYRGYFAWQAERSALARVYQAIWEVRVVRLIGFLTRDMRRHRLEGMVEHELQPPPQVGHAPGGPPPPPEAGAPHHHTHEEIEARTHCPGAQVPLAEALRIYQAGPQAEALDPLQRTLEQDPGCDMARSMAVGIALTTDRFELASTLLDGGGRGGELPLEALRTFILYGHARHVVDWMERELSSLPEVGPSELELLGAAYEAVGDLERADQTFERCQQRPVSACSCTWARARVALRAGDQEAARAQLAILDRTSRESCGPRDMVGLVGVQCSMGLTQQARERFFQALTTNPGEWYGLLRLIQPCLTEEDLPRVEQALRASAPDVAVLEEVIRELRRGQDIQALVEPWLEGEIAAIARTVRSHDLPLVMATYPNPLWVNQALRRAAEAEDIPLVDNEQRFLVLQEQGVQLDELYAHDGNNPLVNNDHCSERGYGVLAQGFLETLEAEDLLPTNSPRE